MKALLLKVQKQRITKQQRSALQSRAQRVGPGIGAAVDPQGTDHGRIAAQGQPTPLLIRQQHWFFIGDWLELRGALRPGMNQLKLKLPGHSRKGHIHAKAHQLSAITELIELLSHQMAEAGGDHQPVGRGSLAPKPPEALPNSEKVLRSVLRPILHSPGALALRSWIHHATVAFLALPCWKGYSRGSSNPLRSSPPLWRRSVESTSQPRIL